MIQKPLSIMILVVLLGACATAPKTASPDGDNKEGGKGRDDDGGDGKKANDDLYVSANFQTLTYSLSNNSLSSRTVNVSKAKDVAGDLEGKLGTPTAKDRKDMIALMAAKRLAGEGVGNVFQVAKKLMIVEMKDDIRHDMPEVAQLELALASIHSRQFPMADHWIDKLISSKSEKTRAAALTARGIIAMIDGRLPEAVAFWNEALNVRKDYEPARLNIGFTALRFGDYKTAKSMLSGLPDDFFINTGMIQIERLADNPQGAAQLCASVLEKKKNYKPALFSCALNEYQGLNNLTKARAQLDETVKAEGGPSAIDEKAYLVIAKIEKDQRDQQKEKDKEKEKDKPNGSRAPSQPGEQAPADGQAAPASEQGGAEGANPPKS